jgi:AbrB family looped-hinge helix DNA binding protein
MSLIRIHDIMKARGIMGTVVESVLHGKSRVSENGRIVIPAQIREAMGISAGEPVLMELEDGVLRVESHRRRIRRIQEEFRKHVPIKPGEMLMSDQLIADRREEARREMEETDREIEEFRLRNERQLG